MKYTLIIMLATSLAININAMQQACEEEPLPESLASLMRIFAKSGMPITELLQMVSDLQEAGPFPTTADCQPAAKLAPKEDEPLSDRLANLADHLLEDDVPYDVLLQRRLNAEVIMIFDVEKKKSALLCAVLDNDTATIKTILAQENARELANEATENGWTPLHAAAALDRRDIMRDLLAAGALVNPPGDTNFSPLHWAVCMKHDGKAAVLLLAAGANHKVARDEDGATPLHLAETKGAIEALLKAGAEIEARDKRGRTPVYNAVYHRISEALVPLCEAGANLEAADSDGKIAMGAGPLFPPMDSDFRKLLFDCWQPQHKKNMDARLRKMFGFKE